MKAFKPRHVGDYPRRKREHDEPSDAVIQAYLQVAQARRAEAEKPTRP